MRNKIFQKLILFSIFFTFPFLFFNFAWAISATLYGEVTDDGGDPNLEVWFEWGKTSGYGQETPHISKYGKGEFSYTISNLENCQTYHYRAVVKHKNFDNKNYGEDKSFTTPCPAPKVLALVSPTITKRVRNISDGEIAPSKRIFADPNEILEFQIILNSGSGGKNFRLKDNPPKGISILKETLKIDGSSVAGDLENGISFGDLGENQTKTITFQAKVLGEEYFNFGSNSLTNTATLYFDNDQYSDSAEVIVVKKAIAGAVTAVPTGIDGSKIFSLILFGGLFSFFFLKTHLSLLLEKLSFQTKKISSKFSLYWKLKRLKK